MDVNLIREVRPWLWKDGKWPKQDVQAEKASEAQWKKGCDKEKEILEQNPRSNTVSLSDSWWFWQQQDDRNAEEVADILTRPGRVVRNVGIQDVQPAY